MGLDDICNTGLVLGLGISSNTGSAFSMADDLKPQRECLSLTLSLPGENYERRVVNKVASKTCKDQFAAGLYCQDSPASSFSSASVKREIDFGSNDDGAETERVSSRITDEDDDGSNGSGGRNKLRLTKAQSAFLEEIFKRYSTLNPEKKQEIARDLKLSARQVEVWFQNRRARTKLKQMEVNHELLKKCCESLTDENRRLQKEIQELKITLAPLYMQQQAATLTMCPSCEKIGQTTTKTPLTINPKHQFCNSFANPSAAC